MRFSGLTLCLFLLMPTIANAMREKDALEAFELSSLKLEAVYFNDLCKPYASVRDPGGYLHRAFKGDYLGRNFGRVVELSKRGIKLREVFENKDGEWVEKETWVPIKPLLPNNLLK